MNAPEPVPNVIIVGFFDVPGFGSDSVEVPCTGNGPAEYRALAQAIIKRHPKVDPTKITRTGSVVEQRDPNEDPGYIDLDDGRTLRQLFDAVDTTQDPPSSRNIGQVFFSGVPCKIMLTFNRAGGHVGLILIPRVKMGSTAIPFSNQIQPQLAVTELPRLIRDILGKDAHAIQLRTRPVVTASVPEAPAPAPTAPPPPAGAPEAKGAPKSGKAVTK